MRRGCSFLAPTLCPALHNLRGEAMRLTMCVAAVVLACGSATAGPPRGLPEGRELDPVVRDYYHGEPPVPPAERAAPREQKASAAAWLVRAGCAAVEAVLSEVTVPLGPCRTKGM